MNQKVLNIFMDRTFDASCAFRAGDTDWANQIITRLKGNYPNDTHIIDNYYNFYLNVPFAEYIKYRMDYMMQNKNKLKLRYK